MKMDEDEEDDEELISENGYYDQTNNDNHFFKITRSGSLPRQNNSFCYKILCCCLVNKQKKAKPKNRAIGDQERDDDFTRQPQNSSLNPNSLSLSTETLKQNYKLSKNPILFLCIPGIRSDESVYWFTHHYLTRPILRKQRRLDH